MFCFYYLKNSNGILSERQRFNSITDSHCLRCWGSIMAEMCSLPK